MALADTLEKTWRTRLQADYPKQSEDTYNGIVQWLLGEDQARFDDLDAAALKIAYQAIEYRYRILQRRYWGMSSARAYEQLLRRLGSLFLIRSKIRTWISLSRDRYRSVQDVLQEVIQEMLQSDNHLRQQTAWIAQCTANNRLRNTLTLASIEEYCLRPIRNQPLLVYRFVNYLRRSQRGGMTQVPTGDLIKLVSDEIATDSDDASLSLLDIQAMVDYQAQQDGLQQQIARQEVKQQFINYLHENLDATAAEWLELYLQGHSQDAIAQKLSMPVQQIYRLREKVNYHAIRVFTLKEQPDLVFSWLKTSLKDHSLGLTPGQWQQYWTQLSQQQQHILDRLKGGQGIESIAQELKLKPKQVISEWAKLYLAAQDLRSVS
ncbi:MAG: HetZ-related protein 2 [Cyanobacteria bacterium P01_A01_bin.123]